MALMKAFLELEEDFGSSRLREAMLQVPELKTPSERYRWIYDYLYQNYETSGRCGKCRENAMFKWVEGERLSACCSWSEYSNDVPSWMSDE